MSVATVSNSLINKNLYHMQKACLTEISVDYHADRYGTDSGLEPAAHGRVVSYQSSDMKRKEMLI